MKSIIVILFITINCFGQSFTFNDLPWLTSPSVTSYTPSSEDSIKYWWVASDLATNTTILSWVDRIVSNIRTNGDAASRPTNSATGVGLTGTTLLTNSTIWVPDSIATVWIVFTPQTPTSLGCIEGSDNSSGYGYVYTTSGGSLRSFLSGGSPTWANYAAGVTYDALLINTNSTGNTVYYTNNVKITAVGGAIPAYTVGMKYFGKDGGAGTAYKGKVLEVAYFTNVLNTTSISNLHWYATNTYHYSP